MSEADLNTLKRQISKYESARAEFLSVESELRLRDNSARVADMLRINRETINAMERSLELVRMRLASACAANHECEAMAGAASAAGSGK